MNYTYKNNRPKLVIESSGGKKLGNCYHAYYYTITSRKALTEDTITSLFDLGFIGYGQYFNIIDFPTEASGQDTVPCIGIDGDKIIENPVNPYSGKPYLPIQESYWIYKTEARCDSGD